MKNKEKHLDEILKYVRKMAVDKNTGEIYSCDGFACGDCLFVLDKSCIDGRKKWFEEEIEKD